LPSEFSLASPPLLLFFILVFYFTLFFNFGARLASLSLASLFWFFKVSFVESRKNRQFKEMT